ncbi:cytochrome C oxidase subunit II [Lentibacillus cibarius]|uniref:Cytochrome aa3 subunit 2 n=1 Tax=Lentibacillus cibarius TaxID=2583219 RepID=A0A549YMM6_9BACI|nr:cytochrome C oxidase subunit II [Lentibacillus cibarius]TMN21340.1 cytochrome C oxidase subunit II [Lentibacillus cibarius]TRM13132.1 cytochrome C oxidase subunit II [Lentibacillus cibarius]
MVQTVAWVTSLFFMFLVLVVFAVVAWKSTERKEYAPIKKKWYKARTFYASVLIVLMTSITIYTLRELPYSQPVYGADQEPVVVDVEGMQFGWEMSQTEFKVGEPVEFHVTSKDVNHGFGIYDEEMNMLAQTQAMPDYTNKVYMTFDEPGTYEILCLEYCGLAHDLMTAEITVTE